MDYRIATIIISLAAVVINITTMMFCFQSRKPVPLYVAILVFFSTLLTIFIYYTRFLTTWPIMRGLLYIPFILLFFKGIFVQIIFSVFTQMFISYILRLFIDIVVRFFIPYGTTLYHYVFVVATLIVYAVYLVLVFKYGKKFLNKLLSPGQTSGWVLYTLSIVVAVIVTQIVQKTLIDNTIVYISVLLFIFWSFVILCFAIINTHDKTKEKQEAEFARNIISTGREYYQKINEQYDALRIMRHDYKFHLNTALDMLRKGETKKSDEYLAGLQNQLENTELLSFCDNPVINSLIADYAKKFKDLNIDFDVCVNIPVDFKLSNYEMCIVLGNLLENAMEACQKIEKNRLVKLVIKPQGEQLAIMIRNTHDGKVEKDGDKFISTKKDNTGSGFGLQSVMAVVTRYGEMFHVEYDSECFNVFVLWKQN